MTEEQKQKLKELVESDNNVALVYDWEYLDSMFCVGCGHKGIYQETGCGDYEVGPLHVCPECKRTFCIA